MSYHSEESNNSRLIQMSRNQSYESPSGLVQLRREGPYQHWVLRVDGSFIDRNKYLTDIADRYGYTLVDNGLL